MFCNYCGHKLQQENTNKCPNPKCGHSIPADSKFCPDCGNKLQIGNTESYSEAKQWSTLEDFKKGIIICDGITLGKTTILDLRKKHYKIEKKESGTDFFSAYDIEKEEGSTELDIMVPASSETELRKAISEKELPRNFYFPFGINNHRYITGFSDNSGMGFYELLKSIGYIGNDIDEKRISLDIFLEDCGYSRSIFDLDDVGGCYISNVPNENGHYIFIQLCDEESIDYIVLAYMNRWENYYTGEVTKID